MNTKNNITKYLDLCGARAVNEDFNTTHVPPNKQEVQDLLAYLRGKKLNPVIIGSVGVAHHLKPDQNFRPTADLDVFVEKEVTPPEGWTKDAESPGVLSWISPTGGYVDFMLPGHKFPGGEKNPKMVAVDPGSPKEYPVGAANDLLKLKLNSMREKDLLDAIVLVRAMGRVPDARELGKLTQTQIENLDLVRVWFAQRPHGKYGE